MIVEIEPVWMEHAVIHRPRAPHIRSGILGERVFERNLDTFRVGWRDTRPRRVRIGTDALVKNNRIVSVCV